MTTTIEHLRLAVERLSEELGVKLHLQEGSKTYGRAYRLYTMQEGSSAHYNPPYQIRDYLGMTRQEAYDTLWSLIHGVQSGKEFSTVMRIEALAVARMNAIVADINDDIVSGA
jgi:hypothetical protein